MKLPWLINREGSLSSVIVFLLSIVLCIGILEGMVLSAYSRFLDLDVLWAAVVVDLAVMLVLLACTVAASLLVGWWHSALAAWFVFSVVIVTTWLRNGLPGVGRPIAVLLSLSSGIAGCRCIHANRSRLLSYQKRTLPWLILMVIFLVVGVRSWEYLHEANVLRSLPPLHTSRPNILLIVIDTLRADHLSTYGYERNTSPNLSRIAAEGVLFDNAIAPSSWTLPSHASMLTGLYPHEHHVELDADVLAAKWPTVAEVLLSRGYRTGAFSANVLNFSRSCGLARGFAHFEDYLGANPMTLFSRTPLGWRIQLWARHFGRKGSFVGRQRAEHINQRALAWIDKQTSPFFVMLNYLDVHDPYRPPEPYRHAFTKDKDPGGEIGLLFDHVTNADARTIASETAVYDGGIRYVDDQIQDLMNALRKRALLDDTIVIITSDHGEAFGEHNLLMHKNGLYREVVHVPLIIWHPKTIRGGRHISRPISLVDIPKTVITFADPSYKGPFPGHSLQELWTNDASGDDMPAPLSELARIPFIPQFPNYYGPVRSVIDSEHQYIDQKGGELLYDWKADPQELHNLCPIEPQTCAVLRAKMMKAIPSPDYK